MDIQFYGANCILLTYKSVRLIVDDNLNELGKKSIIKPGDVAILTSSSGKITPTDARITLDSPGEYEIADISVVGIPVRSHTNAEDVLDSTMFKIVAGDSSILVCGHIQPQLSNNQLETIGLVDVLMIPIGNHGYTLDPNDALTVIKEIEPKLVIPTHYASPGINYPVPQLELEQALKDLAMEPKETVAKLKLRQTELGDVTQLIVLEIS